MIIRLPGTQQKIDTLGDINEIIEQTKNAFAKFTFGTAEAYTYEDKLLWIDRLQEELHPGEDYDKARNAIVDYFKWNLDEYGEVPDKDDYWNMEFFETCVEAGHNRLRDQYEKGSHKDNDKTLKAIAKMIQTVMCWEWEG